MLTEMLAFAPLMLVAVTITLGTAIVGSHKFGPVTAGTGTLGEVVIAGTGTTGLIQAIRSMGNPALACAMPGAVSAAPAMLAGANTSPALRGASKPIDPAAAK